MADIIRIVRSKEAWLAEQAAAQRPLVKRFDAAMSLAGKAAKTFQEVKDAAGNVVDYLDVKISGYLSTFQDTTPSDMVGDYVEPGAFSETIARFMKNPVMLKDHYNNTSNLVGRFTTVREDKKGLWVEGQLSNAPGVRDIRFLVAEEMLRTMSMGGYFYYRENGHAIFKVVLYEGSLTPIPANPDAMLEVRAMTEADWKKLDLAA